MEIVWKIVEGLSRGNMDGMETIVGALLVGALDNVIAENKREGRAKPCPYRGNDIIIVAGSMTLIYNRRCCGCSI